MARESTITSISKGQNSSEIGDVPKTTFYQRQIIPIVEGPRGREPPRDNARGSENPTMPRFQCPKRLDYGTEGKEILLRANHFKVSTIGGTIFHYYIDIQPDKCPRKVNR